MKRRIQSMDHCLVESHNASVVLRLAPDQAIWGLSGSNRDAKNGHRGADCLPSNSKLKPD
jgi:hypothetical protein